MDRRRNSLAVGAAAVSGRRTGNRTGLRPTPRAVQARSVPRVQRRQQASCGAACVDKATLYATLTPPNATKPAAASRAPALLTLVRDGKRAMSKRFGSPKKKCAVRATAPRHRIRGTRAVRRCEAINLSGIRRPCRASETLSRPARRFRSRLRRGPPWSAPVRLRRRPRAPPRPPSAPNPPSW
jgi:hypothetical protein